MMNVNIGDRLRALRLRAGLTQDAVAEYLGISDVAVCNYENGTIDPSLDNFYKLVSLFDTSADYLLGLDDDKRLVIDVHDLSEHQESFLIKIVKQIIHLIKGKIR